jgi:hypothetical protein
VPGATARAKAAEEQAKAQAEQSAKQPPQPDPNEVAVRAWAIRDEATALALEALIDKAILVAAAERRLNLISHSAMAFSEGVCAGLEALKQKLTNLRTS